MEEANPRCCVGIMPIMAVEFAGLKTPLVIALKMISSAGRNQSESVRSRAPTLSDATMIAAPKVAGARGPKRSDIYPLRGAKGTGRIDGAIKGHTTALADKCRMSCR